MKINFNFPDSRLSSRLEHSFDKIRKTPDRSFPKIFSAPGELLGFYRLISNKRMSVNDFLNPVLHEAVDKSVANKNLLIAHDTTEAAVACLDKKLHLHFSVAIKSSEPYVYGAVNLKSWFRDDKKLVKDSEHLRWFEAVQEVEKRYENNFCNLIHLMDREGDSYHTISKMIESNYRFVIRLCHDRKINGKGIKELVRAEEILLEREVRLSPRRKTGFTRADKIHPERHTRKCILSVRSKEIEISRSERLKKGDYPDSIKINVVSVEEKNPPEGETAVSWFLLTSERIDDKSDIENVIDNYRRRWVIEEFFKALKSGCAVEQRQFESNENWLKILCLFLPISAQALNLRLMDEKEEQILFNKNQMKILEKMSKKYKMPLGNTGEVKMLIAKMGGHIKSNGPPGWSVLMKGMVDLITMEIGWILAQSDM